MDKFQIVIARWHVLDRIISIKIRHGEKRMINHTDIRFHPWMDVALDPQRNLLRCKLTTKKSAAGFAQIECCVALGARSGIYVMENSVRIGDQQTLPCHQSQYQRLEFATDLAQHRRFVGDREFFVSETAFDINENICQAAVRRNDITVCCNWRFVKASANGIHLNWGFGRWSVFHIHTTGDAGEIVRP
ncbi:MAG: hypothetical protein JWQ04_777 [Pedosphaera sp.]|nr:hypothetical protein [Pedosphaera sp.]